MMTLLFDSTFTEFRLKICLNERFGFRPIVKGYFSGLTRRVDWMIMTEKKFKKYIFHAPVQLWMSLPQASKKAPVQSRL